MLCITSSTMPFEKMWRKLKPKHTSKTYTLNTWYAVRFAFSIYILWCTNLGCLVKRCPSTSHCSEPSPCFAMGTSALRQMMWNHCPKYGTTMYLYPIQDLEKFKTILAVYVLSGDMVVSGNLT